jgi:hypothetical protein
MDSRIFDSLVRLCFRLLQQAAAVHKVRLCFRLLQQAAASCSSREMSLFCHTAFLMAAIFQPSVALAVDRGSTEAFIFFTIDSAMRSSSGSESDLFRNRRAILEFLNLEN